MILISCYYIFFASAVILYGAGINSSTIVSDFLDELFLPLSKILASILCTTILAWLIIKHLLVPLGLAELFPIVAILIFLILSVFLETFVRITIGKTTSEFCFSFLIILIALNESLTIIDVLIISIGSFISFIVLIPLIYSFKKRIDIVGNLRVHGNKKSLILVSMAILVTIIAIGNVSWLNSKVLP